MNWVVFSASLPSKGSSSPRVTLWRRLQRLGAVAPVGGLYVLPAQEACVEAFEWLAQEIRQAQGDALVAHVERFEGLSDAQLVALFNAARDEEYAELETGLVPLETSQASTPGASARGAKTRERLQEARVQEALVKVRRRQSEIARVDYFDAPGGARLRARLATFERARAAQAAPAGLAQVAPASLKAYRQARWVTRPRPHVDRLACAWLIRRFINPAAPIRYAAKPKAGEVTFDIDGALFGHQGNLCSFETMLRAFGLGNPALAALGEIVHEIDLQDGLYFRPEIAGVDAVLRGWALAELPDGEREARGLALFEGLYRALTASAPPASAEPGPDRSRPRRPRRPRGPQRPK